MAKKPHKPSPKPAAKPQSAMDKMIEDCVKRSQARKKSGQTDREWRERYAASLKVESVVTAPMSETPFQGDTFKKKV